MLVSGTDKLWQPKFETKVLYGRGQSMKFRYRSTLLLEDDEKPRQAMRNGWTTDETGDLATCLDAVRDRRYRNFPIYSIYCGDTFVRDIGPQSTMPSSCLRRIVRDKLHKAIHRLPRDQTGATQLQFCVGSSLSKKFLLISFTSSLLTTWPLLLTLRMRSPLSRSAPVPLLLPLINGLRTKRK